MKNTLTAKNRALLRELVVTDFKLRYQGSVLGYLWSLLKPLMLFAILYVVFIHFMRFGSGSDHFAVQMLLGIVMWSFFVEATSQGMSAIVMRGDLIRKINFPKYIIVISGTISALINLLLNIGVVLIFIIVNGVDIRINALLFILNILELYVFALGIAFFLSALFVKYRDVSHIWEVLLQGLFYATPIIYPFAMVFSVSPIAAKAMLLSPIAQTIQDARFNLISPTVSTLNNVTGNVFMKAVPYVIVAIVVVVAVLYFRKNQKYFAENV